MGLAKPRRLFYGWVMVAVCGLTVAIVFGIRLSFGVFFVALNEEFGWGRGATAGVFSLSMVVFALTAAPVGFALDRWGPRLVSAVGGLWLAVGLALCSRVGSLWGMLLAYGVVASIGISILGLGTQGAIISRWFVRRRGLAIGLVFAGSGLGTLLLTPGVERLIALVGWRGAYLVLAGLAALLVPLSWLLRHSPREVGQAVDGGPSRPDSPLPLGEGAGVRVSRSRRPTWTWRQASRTAQFWVLILAALGAIGPLRMLTVHQVAYAVDAGFSRFFAASLFGAGGALTAATFVVSGGLSDRLGRHSTYLVGSACLGAAILVLLRVAGPADLGWLYAYTVLEALGEGARSSLVTAIASDTFPGEHMGAINGSVGAAYGAGAAVSTWLAGALYDSTGSYGVALWTALAAVVVSAVCVHLIGRYPPRLPGPVEVVNSKVRW